ncbi:MAG: hypothetical protein ACM3X7_04035 [Solirubrobacterales bacterium]
MDIIGIKGTDTSSYQAATNMKKNIDNTEKTKTELGIDTFEKSEDTGSLTYKPVKNKLSAEEVKSLKEEQENQKAELIKKFISDTIKNQNRLVGKSNNGESGISKGSSDLLTKIFGSVENAYPPLATSPEGAQAAITDGGAYSVNAVADRIMTMAQYFAGDDPEKLQQMRDAVEKGFAEAGYDFKNATDSDLPQICQDTIAEVMRRFDQLQNK